MQTKISSLKRVRCFRLSDLEWEWVKEVLNARRAIAKGNPPVLAREPILRPNGKLTGILTGVKRSAVSP